MIKNGLELVIFFADVAGSTRLYETLGDIEAHDCIVESLSHISKYVRQHKGAVVEVIGDEVMAYFETSVDAVSCACDIQQHFSFTPTSKGHKINIRIGFYKGPVELDNGHPFGDTINVAARVTSLAQGGQTMTTADTVEGLPEDKMDLCRPYNKVKVKGKSEAIDTVEVVWDLDDATSLFAPVKASQVIEEAAELRLQISGRTVVVREQNTPFIIGRGDSSNLVVPSETASRSHARIECRYGELVLTDHSTNGTYVITHPGKRAFDGLDMHLHHREWTMQGSGLISLGRPTDGSDPICISFSNKKH
ncbi:MAG: hypothetical protein COA99_02565 [Moraxellaceae bacterium]|nr:MAG: hypothetical protein COA99_02565 [Moraxellaceae bacterium]